MTNRFRKGVLPLAIASLFAVSPFAIAQNVTSSAVTGQVLNASGTPVAGATVKIVNVPSGTTKIVTTDASGRYNAKGLRVGGPYDITVTKAGLASSQRDQVFLQLGQTSAINLTMQPSTANAQKLGAVVVTANALSQIFSPDNKGVSTNISERQLDAMPTPGRTIQDVIRMDPLVNIVGRSEGKFSALGQNYRYNNITIDGVGDNDSYGLNANGLPTTGTPISQDAIAAYNISTANYDVTNRKGLGASVNAVIKSGTNKFHGSLYYVFQDHNWVGKNEEGKKFNGFDRNWTGGATFSGPIIKDKLFFFLNYEKSDQVGAASTYGPEGSNSSQTVQGLTQADLQKIEDVAKGYGMKNLGSFTGGSNDLIDKRYLIKLDWNISNNHRISFTARRTNESQPEIFTGSPDSLTLSSGWIIKSSVGKAYSLQAYDDWSDNFTTKTTFAYRTWRRTGGPYNGAELPSVEVSVGGFGGPTVTFGTNDAYQTNFTQTRDLSGAWIATWFQGNHAIKFGVGFQKQHKDDLFLENSFGNYIFDCIVTTPSCDESFQSGNYFEYRYAQPADNDISNAAGLFTIKRLSAFAQDTWQVNDNLSLQYGLRVDRYKVGNKPLFNPKYAAAGFTTPTGLVLTTNQYTGSDKPVVMPRASFNYSFDTRRLMQLRGGFGLFITQPPAVWIGNSFEESGNNVVSYRCGPTQRGCSTDLPAFSPDPHNQNPGKPGTGAETVNTMDPDFKLPQAWKFSVGYDVQLPWWGLIGTVNYMHLATRYAIWYQDLNTGPATGTLPDGRNSYYKYPDKAPRAKGQFSSNDNNFAFSELGTINLANTRKGKDDSITFQLRKPFTNNWSWMVAATWNHATDVNPGLSSVAESSYKEQMLVNPSDNVSATSNYNVSVHAIASIQWRHAFFDHYYTRVSAFWTGETGHPYSWTFGNDANGDGFTNDLVYIPKPGQVEFCAGNNGDCGAPDPARVKQFWAYIQGNRYLREHQGDIARRNADRAPWYSDLDLSFSQEIPGLFSGSKGQIRVDIYNFLNMLDKSWGQEHRADFPGVRALANFYGVDPKTGKYIYNIDASAYGAHVGNGSYHPEEVPDYSDFVFGDLAQRWQIQVTLRYTF